MENKSNGGVDEKQENVIINNNLTNDVNINNIKNVRKNEKNNKNNTGISYTTDNNATNKNIIEDNENIEININKNVIGEKDNINNEKLDAFKEINNINKGEGNFDNENNLLLHNNENYETNGKHKNSNETESDIRNKENICKNDIEINIKKNISNNKEIIKLEEEKKKEKQNIKKEETTKIKNKNKEKRSKSKSPDNKNRVIYTPEIIEHFNNIKNQSINMNINTLKPEPPMFGENNIYKKPLISLKESRIVNKKDNNKNYYPNYKNFDFFENDYSENKISSDFISPIKIMNNDKDTQILTMPIANFNSPTKKKEKIKEGEGLLKLIDIDEIVKKRKKIKKSKKNGRKMTPDLKHVKSKQKLEENSKDYGKGKINKIIMTEDNEKYIDYSGDNDREGDEFDIVNTVPQNIIKKNRRYSEKRKDNS